ncbi:MAG TPA: FtsX-like permease family protein, partial [Gemmatimonadales bacterium]|nr:FtsX-like permease family protein [Gemmatimonadales bacterium]
REAPQVTIVDDKLAARFWPGEDPLGKRLRRGNDGPWYTVIGVVADEKEIELNAEPPITAYFPLEQLVVGIRYFAVRTAGDPVSLIPAITREVRSLDADLPVFDVSTMEARLESALGRRRFAMVLLGGFAAVAMVLAGIGIYGVTSYWAGQRTREIGIRMAMGAEPGAIRRLVVRQAAVPVGIGIGVGLVAAFGLTRLMSTLLFRVSPTDAISFGLVPLILGAIALVASDRPARQAARVDPITAVRQE